MKKNSKARFLIASDEPSERKAFSSMEKSIKRILMFFYPLYPIIAARGIHTKKPEISELQKKN